MTHLPTLSTHAILVDRSTLGWLQFSGQSRLDLLHRMSTQAVTQLTPGQGAATILTTDIARIIDRLILYADEQQVYCLTSENHSDFIARYLMRFVFFNDDFQIQDLSQKTAILGIYGQQAATTLAAASPAIPTDLPRHHWQKATLGEVAVSVHRADPVGGDGYLLVCAQEDKDALWQHLQQAGGQPVTEETFEQQRIASGLPRFGHELTQEYIPLEANLWADVSFKKGCYIGQEIIARMESRGKLAKQLHRLQVASWVEPGTELRTAEGKKAGVISSAAAFPTGVVALGYIRTAILGEDGSYPTLYAADAPVQIIAST